MAAEFMRTGRFEISSFHGLVTGMVLHGRNIASACGVLNNVGAVTIGAGPRMRPSWLIRSACEIEAIRPRTKANRKTPEFPSNPSTDHQLFCSRC